MIPYCDECDLPKPLTSSELITKAIFSQPISIRRVLATFADESNWIQIYGGEFPKRRGVKAKACEWCFIGPTRPPYELAQWALRNQKAKT